MSPAKNGQKLDIAPELGKWIIKSGLYTLRRKAFPRSANRVISSTAFGLKVFGGMGHGDGWSER
jgi:hypothetical protein